IEAQHRLAEHFWRRVLRALAGMRAWLRGKDFCIRRRNTAGLRGVAETVTGGEGQHKERTGRACSGFDWCPYAHGRALSHGGGSQDDARKQKRPMEGKKY